MGEWKDITLGAVLKYEQPYKYTVESTQYNNSGVPVLTAGKSFILGYTSEMNNLYSNLPVIIFDDFTSDCKFVDFPFKVKSSAMKFLKERNEEEISLKYFYEILQTLKLDSVGGDHKRRWISEYSKIKIKAPDFIEQTRIAEILSTADEAIAHTEALIAKYQRIKTGLMQDLLTKGIDEKGNIRSKETHKFVVKNGVEVPEEWEVKQIIKTTYIKARIGWQGLKASEFIIEGPYLVTGTDFQNGEINWKTCYHVTEERFQEAKYIQLKENDLLITKDGTIGKTALVRNCPEKAVLNSGVFVLRCNDGSFKNEFLYYILNSKYFEDFLYKTQGGSTINHLYQREFERFYFPCPDITEQNKIINVINQSIDLITEEKFKLSKLQSIKTGLMQDLLSGKVRVNMDNKN